MDYFDIGVSFESYRDLIEKLTEYCAETGTKYWKKNCKLLNETDSDLCEALIYKEIKFVCVHSGMRIENVRQVYEKCNCPAYFRFKAMAERNELQLIAVNENHNHVLGEIDYEQEFLNMREEQRTRSDYSVKRIRLQIDSDDFDIDQRAEYIDLLIDNSIENNVNFDFKGLMAPVFTIFNEDQTIDTSSILKYAKFLLNSGIRGVLVHGTTGEGMSMTVEERKVVTEAWVAAVKETKQHLMVQVGGAPMPDVISLAKHAESVGVDSILCLPELYFKPSNSAELTNYLKIVGEAAPKTPLLYYHIPAWTNVTIHMGKFLNHVAGQIPTFKGIKFTSNNLEEGMEAVKAKGGRFSVFLGADTLLAGAFALGFDSAIATTLNIFPQFSVQILNASKASKLQEAQEYQEKLTAVTSIITKHGAWVPTMKVAMNIATPINVGLVRPPLVNLTEEQILEMKESLSSYM